MNGTGRKLWNVGDTAGTPRIRALAAALRKVIAESSMSLREVAHVLDRSHTTLSQWQTGKRVPEPEDVSALLAVLRVTGKRRDEIMNLARHHHEANWLAAGLDGMSSAVEFERDAIEITEWQPLLIPGVLQTADYAGAIIGANPNLAQSEMRAQVDLRLSRRQAFKDRGDVRVAALIGEHALRQRVGGLKAMLGQLDHLLHLMAEDFFEIRVVPGGVGWHAGLIGPFVIYKFSMTPPIVLLEHHRTSAFLYSDGEVEKYQIALSDLRKLALSRDDSVAVIKEVRG